MELWVATWPVQAKASLLPAQDRQLRVMDVHS